jgi:hypothetical protein
MRSFTWLAGLAASGVLALLGAIYGCSSGSDHPPVLQDTYDAWHPSSSSGGSSSGSSSGSGSGSGSGSSSGGMMTCPTVDGGCTDLGLCGMKVFSMNRGGSAPVPQGGAVAPGIYVLTKIDIYGSLATFLQESIRLTAPGGGGDGGAAEGGNDAGTMEASSDGGVDMDATMIDAGGGDAGVFLGWESISIAQGAPLSTAGGTVGFPDSTTMSITFTCGNAPDFTSGYTATPTSLALIYPPLVYTYTKQ